VRSAIPSVKRTKSFLIGGVSWARFLPQDVARKRIFGVPKLEEPYRFPENAARMIPAPRSVAKELLCHSSTARRNLDHRTGAGQRTVDERGRSNKIIASHLSISEATVKAHIKNILLKLGASDRTHAVNIATTRGFLMQ